MTIFYIDRTTGKKKIEKVYGARGLEFLYGNSWISRTLGRMLQHAASRWPFVSALYGDLQKTAGSRRKIAPFIKAYDMDPTEFLEPYEAYASFNDFFTRKLKPEARPLAASPAIMPADGRYLFHQDIHASEGFFVKGQKFTLASLLQDERLAARYKHGAMVMARLCPTDYHRFHFPCAGVPSETRYLNGWLYSVNPIAIRKNIEIFTQNKRTTCEIESDQFGKVLFLEIGATAVGSIHQTYQAHTHQAKGAEKGYFSFGASSLIILFEPSRIVFDGDLIEASKTGMEVRCLFGQSLGSSTAEFR